MRTFRDLGDFISFLTSRVATLPEAQMRALDHGAEVIEAEAKGLIGTYAAGWPQLAEATQADRVRKGFAPNEPLLRTGELRDSIEHRVTSPEAAAVGTDHRLAEVHEFGTSRIPPRPVLGAAAARKGDAAAQAVGREIAAHLAGKD